MKSVLLKRKTLAAALVAASGFASAASYYVVVPLPAKAAASKIAVSLQPQTLPAGLAGSRYADFDFRTGLIVTGDPDFQPQYVRWSLVSGALPAGLSISANGILTGTPSSDGDATFELQAYYKSKTGTQHYVLTIKERGSVATVYGTGLLDWGTIERTVLPQVRSIAVTNTGDRPMTLSAASVAPFTLVGSTCTNVAPSGTCSLAYRLGDTAPGDYGPATVTVSGASAGATAVRLAARVTGPLAVAEPAADVSFGTATQSDVVANKAITWRNKGNTPMTLATGSITAPFSVVANTCTNVGPGATCQITFAMDSQTAGDYSASPTLAGGGSALTASLAGKVVSFNLTASLTQVAFGTVPVGTPATRKVTVTNASAARAPLTVPTMAAPFSQTNDCPAYLGAGATCEVVVKYSPADLTAQSAVLALPGLNIPVSGTGGKVSIETAGTGRRWQDGTYAASCNGYLTAGGNYQYAGATGSGVYTVDPDGAGAQPTVDVYCDMATDGGGWTLVTNAGRDGDIRPTLIAAAGDYNIARNPASTVGGAGSIGINRWANSFGFSMARLEVIAGDDAGQVAAFYKTVTYANLASWGVSSAVEPNATKTCSDRAMTQNCTLEPFDHSYFGTPGDTLILRGVNLLAYGYPASTDIPVHGRIDTGLVGGFCSVTGNNNNNQWHDSYADGHWGNGLRIWLR